MYLAIIAFIYLFFLKYLTLMIVLKKKKKERLNSISGEYLNLTEPKPKHLIHLESQIEGERFVVHLMMVKGERCNVVRMVTVMQFRLIVWYRESLARSSMFKDGN